MRFLSSDIINPGFRNNGTRILKKRPNVGVERAQMLNSYFHRFIFKRKTRRLVLSLFLEEARKIYFNVKARGRILHSPRPHPPFLPQETRVATHFPRAFNQDYLPRPFVTLLSV